MPLAGRRRESSLLDAAMHELESGAVLFVEVCGEPGIGKTRLLKEFTDRWSADRLIWSGRGTEFERTVPFGIFIDIAEQQATAELLDRFRHEWPREAALLAEILPRFGSPAIPARGHTSEERYHLYRSARLLIEAAAATTGLLLILDDVHWADPDSAELLGYLLRRPPHHRVLTIMAHRPRQLPVRLAAAFASAERDGCLRRIDLGPLSRAESDQMLGPGLSRASRDALYLESGGNPFYLAALAAAGYCTSPSAGGGKRPAQVTERVHALLVAEVDHLSPDARTVAVAAAVAGDPFDTEHAAAIARLPPEPVAAALEELTVRDIIRPEGIAGRFGFRHPLVRTAIYGSAQTGWLVDAHARGAEFLAGLGLPMSARANHIEVAARHGDVAAAQVLAGAAREVVPYAPATAALWLDSAVRLIPVAQDPDLELRFELAYALGISGQFRRSWEILKEILSQLPASSDDLRRRVLALTSTLERHLGHEANARKLLEAELADHRQRGVDEASDVILLLELCYHNLMTGDTDGQRKCAEKVLRLAGPDDDLCRAGAEGQLALVSYHQGDIDGAIVHQARAASLIDEIGDVRLSEDLDACCHLAWSELHLQLFRTGLRHVERAIDIARDCGRGFVMAQAMVLRAVAYRGLGDLAAAMRSIGEALEIASLIESSRWRMTALAAQCEIASVVGDLALASAAGAEALRLATGPADAWIVRHVPATLAATRFLAGDTDGCVDIVVDTFGGAELPRLDPGNRARCYESLAWMEVLQGRTEQAQGWALRAERQCVGVHLPCAVGYAHLARAVTFLGPRPQDALRHARQAIAEFRSAGARYEVGRASYVAALALVGAGRHDEADTLMREAENIVVSCGAAPMGSYVATVAAQVVPGQPAAGDASGRALSPLDLLSPRERQIADLVARGSTNRLTARHLGVSEKTIETHLSRIFAKLEVSNRAMLASIVSRESRRSSAY
jgi:DNA-binding CsgD family transcriptional regulator/tetratricopeptide (TPR) repeat protein